MMLTELTSRALHSIAGFLPVRIISEDGTSYLERYYVGTALGMRFYLHRFVGSDPARGLHDHPWSFALSLILSGWYFEEALTTTRKVRWWNTLRGKDFHRVCLPVGKDGRPMPCWTLFCHRATYVKPWGFLRDTAQGPQWQAYNHPLDGTASSGEWWKTAPQGRFIRRQAA